MIDVLTLPFDAAPYPDYRGEAIDTSAEAAIANREKRPSHRELVLAALIEAGPSGLNDFELASKVGLQQTSCGVRRCELVKLGKVRALEGVRRPSTTGSPSQVWVAVQ